MPLNIRPLSENFKLIARTELNEDENRLQEEIETFREWILMQPHLKARTNDQFLLAFLRGSKHSLEKAKSKIDHFYTIREMIPEVFKNLDVSGKLTEIAATGAFATEYALQNRDSCVINGYVEIIDLSKSNINLYLQADLVLLKKLGVFFEKAIPLRLRGLHIINCPKEKRDLLLFARSLLFEKYKKLFFVHKTLKDLYKYVPCEALPVEYGGSNGTIAEIAALNALDTKSGASFYAENDQYGVDERLRLHNKCDEKSIFGLEGSFRKLDID